jgi:uncharacterized protein Yka (UPF0111/DUF47 family)
MNSERLRAGEAGRAGMLAESARRKKEIADMEARVDTLQAEACQNLFNPFFNDGGLAGA